MQETSNNIMVASSNKVFTGDVSVSFNDQNTLGHCNSNVTGYVKESLTGILDGNITWPSGILGGNYYYEPLYKFSYQHDYAWRVDVSKNNRISLSIDVPGVALADINVDIDAYNVRVTGKRHDTGTNVSHSYTLPQCYDTKSITAKLDSGVLTLTVKKLAGMTPRKITVKAA
jgi:hypothetical protein